VTLNGGPAEEGAAAKVRTLLDRVRREAGLGWRAQVITGNDFPTASGLASSASGFAALALAALGAAGLSWPSPAVSALARASSVSAARSIFGGFVALEAGAAEAEPIAIDTTPLRMVIAVTQTAPKKVGSTQGMLRTIYSELRGALARGDLERVGEAMEQSTLCMHATMLAAAPAISYFSPQTITAMDCVRDLRAAGTFAYFTMDAGPHVKVLTLADRAERVRRELETVPGVHRVLVSAAGGGARIVEAP
jgi:diphosphomevalonate decarboxylase